MSRTIAWDTLCALKNENDVEGLREFVEAQKNILSNAREFLVHAEGKCYYSFDECAYDNLSRAEKPQRLCECIEELIGEAHFWHEFGVLYELIGMLEHMKLTALDSVQDLSERKNIFERQQ